MFNYTVVTFTASPRTADRSPERNEQFFSILNITLDKLRYNLVRLLYFACENISLLYNYWIQSFTHTITPALFLTVFSVYKRKTPSAFQRLIINNILLLLLTNYL